ncbi:MAG: PQQ-binding-like beta-propeller repeat protein, partial [Peptococcaceae bacterium]
MRQNQKKLISLLLLLAMLFTILPAAAFAGTEADPTSEYTWPSFRGQENNMAITNIALPTSTTNAALKWDLQLSYMTPPTIVGNKIYVASVDKLYAVDRTTGNENAVSLAGSLSWYQMPVIYGDGKLFVSYDNGQVQAFDAVSLESLWVSEPLGGYIAAPATYKDGFLYVGNYNWSGTEFYYTAIHTVDEDTTDPLETKQYVWKFTDEQAFYWAGAYVTDQAVIFGSESGRLYSVKKTDGTMLDSIDVSSPIRSTIAYDAATEAVYFTTNQGQL